MTTFQLNITRVEYTLDGVTLDIPARWTHSRNRILGVSNSDIVRRETVLFSKTFKSYKAAWAFATNELVDSCGVVYDRQGLPRSEYADYCIFVNKI